MTKSGWTGNKTPQVLSDLEGLDHIFQIILLSKECKHCSNIILCKRLLLSGSKVLDVHNTLSHLIAAHDREERNRLLVSIVKLLLEL